MTQIKYLIIGVIVGGALMYLMSAINAQSAQTTTGNTTAVSAPAAASAATPAATPTTTPTTSPAPPSSNESSANDFGSSPVVTINKNPITLRQVEDTLLSQEGVRQLLEMLEKQYSVTDWSKLKDKDVIVQTATWRLTRVMLAAQLLQQKAGDAREDLIGIELVRQALEKEKIVIDETAIQNEVKRMEKRHYDALEVRNKPYMEFRSFIEQTQKMKFDEYIHQEGFKMGAGIRILVERQAQQSIADEQLQDYLKLHINNYRVQEAADLSSIYIPYQLTKDANGADVVTEEEKIRLFGVMQQLHKAIISRQVSFERTFQTFGKVYEQHADPGGRLGFVNRDGKRPIKGSRVINSLVMDEAFAAQPPYPVLLKPIATAEGMELALVHSRRSGKEPVFNEIKNQVISDIVDAELTVRTQRTLEGLRRDAVIDYQSLPPLIKKRAQDAGLTTATQTAP